MKVWDFPVMLFFKLLGEYLKKTIQIYTNFALMVRDIAHIRFLVFVQDIFDYSPPSYVIQIGSVSLTSKGSNVELAVWTLDAPVFNASASATINIT